MSEEHINHKDLRLNPISKQIDEWFIGNSKNTGSDKETLKKVKSSATGKLDTMNESGHETDSSMKSTDSRQSTTTINKRTHASGTSSGESSTASPKTKRATNTRKGKGRANKKD